MQNQTIFEKLDDYDGSIEKALAGFLTGKKLEDLQSKEIENARKLIQKLPDWNDQLELSFALDREDEKIIKKILKKISESKKPVVSFFPLDGINLKEDFNKDFIFEEFKYALHCENVEVRDSLIDWLDKNRIKFTLIDEYKIFIKCDDRETIYKIGKIVTKINRKNKMVRDSLISKKKVDEVSQNQEKVKNTSSTVTATLPKSRNPMAKVLANPLFRPRIEKSKKEKIQKKDNWDRNTKHKKKILEMKDLPEIKRLQTLAGIRPESNNSLSPGPVETNIELPVMGASIANIPPVVNTAATDLQATMDPVKDATVVDIEKENNDIIEPTNTQNSSISTTTSEQYSRALEMLDQILALVSELKISEYRMFVSRVNSFVDSVKQVGRVLVNENREKK